MAKEAAQPQSTRATVKVASKAENSYVFYPREGATGIVIEGTHPYFKRTRMETQVAYTEISSEHWEAIKARYASKTGPIYRGVIFAEKNHHETQARAGDPNTLGIRTGTERIDMSRLDPNSKVISLNHASI